MTTDDIPVLIFSSMIAYCGAALLGDWLGAWREKKTAVATRRLWRNTLILVAGSIVVGAPRFATAPMSSFVPCASITLGSLIALKGISRLPCPASDLFLAYILVGLVLIEVFTKHSAKSGGVLYVITILVFIFFAKTGVTFKGLAREHAAHGSS